LQFFQKAIQAISDSETAKSQICFIVILAGVPLYWQSKMQTIIALSTAESEQITISETEKFVRSIAFIIDELQTRGLLTNLNPKNQYKVSKDYATALEISKSPKIRPHKRHVNVFVLRL
jgi:hypothetical protein